MRYLLLTLIILLTGCAAAIIAPAAPDVTIDEQVFNDTFDTPGSWDSIDRPDQLLNVEDSVYRALLSQRGGLLWGVNYQTHDDILLETTVAFRSANDRTIAGIVCRATPAPNERGYLFLISQDGAFSIRKLAPNQDTALVKWQNHRAVQTGGRSNEIRALCDGDTLALWINNTFVRSVTDSDYRGGYTGLVLGLPASAPDTPALAQFEYVTGWSLR